MTIVVVGVVASRPARRTLFRDARVQHRTGGLSSDVFDAKKVGRLSSQSIVQVIIASDVWPDWSAFDAKSLASTLARFKFHSANQRFADGTEAMGYHRGDFEEA
jgi:hypothetical protein